MTDPVLDNSCQVVELWVPDDTSRSAEEVRVLPIPRLSPRAMMPAGLLAVKAKLFSDGVMAAVELAADAGCGRLPGRRAVLQAWYDACASDYLAGALHLRGSRLEAPALVREFLANPASSKPISFYTWSPQLEAIFRSDRFLQSPLPAAEAARLTPYQPAEAYRAQLNLAARMTNPFSKDAPALFPASQAPETTLARELLGNRPIPEGFDLTNEVIRALKAGKLSLAPSAESGWYAHQQWPLEALVHDRDNREKSKLSRSASYQKALEEMFRSLFALTRETHVKQLEQLSAGCAGPSREIIVDVAPRLRIEPLVTYYERVAKSFAFVRDVLREALGPAGLAQLRRETPQGPVEQPLAEELQFMIDLFTGCAQVACEDLGMSDRLGDPSVALDWLRFCHEDPDLDQDVRCMVPLFYDVERKKTKVLAVIGYSERPLTISFATPPRVVSKPPNVRVRFVNAYANLVYPVAVEMYVDRLFDRPEFRKLCDAFPTLTSLRAALGQG